MPIRLPSHLYRNQHGGFYFRFVIPKDLRPHLQRREVCFSLQTEQRHEAILSAFPLIADLPRLRADLRRMTDANETPPIDYFEKWREELIRSGALSAKIQALESKLADQEERLKKAVQKSRAKDVAKLMLNRGLDQGKASGYEAAMKEIAFPWPAERTPCSRRLNFEQVWRLNFDQA